MNKMEIIWAYISLVADLPSSSCFLVLHSCMGHAWNRKPHSSVSSNFVAPDYVYEFIYLCTGNLGYFITSMHTNTQFGNLERASALGS